MTFHASVWLLFMVLMSLLFDGSLADALHMASPLRQQAPLQKKSFPSFLKDYSKIVCLSETSSTLFQSDAVASRNFADIPTFSMDERLSILPDQLLQGRSAVHKFCVAVAKGSFSFVKRWWWALPMGLAFVPVYSSLVLKVLPSMPHWWPLTKMDKLLNNPKYGLIVTVFLSSNAFYLASGLYLLTRFSCKSNAMQGYKMLGTLVLTAGVVSTVFHYYQALGSFRIAEALCYIDHAVAITSILSFWHRCGRPGVFTTILGLTGIATLVITDPLHIYPYLHSAWHCLSAGAAILWAHDGVNRRLRTMEKHEELVTE
jgi:hypothetical protein